MFDWDLIQTAIDKSSSDSSVYVGCDSKKKRKKLTFVTTIIIHHGSNSGASVFIAKQKEIAYSIYQKLQSEIYKAAEVAAKVKPMVGDRNFEVHLDLNPNHKYISNRAIAEARGAILGIVGIEPVFKPDAFAASCAADRFTIDKNKL